MLLFFCIVIMLYFYLNNYCAGRLEGFEYSPNCEIIHKRGDFMLTDINAIELAENLKKTENRIDIIKIANELGIKVFLTEEISVPSFIAYDAESDCYEIYVNSKEPSTRKRFSIAHEIAHFILHKDKINTFGIVGRQNSKSLSKAEEQAADTLGAKILIPEKCAIEYLKYNGVGIEDIIGYNTILDFSKEFEVSLIAGAMRLRELGYYVGYIEV